MSLCVCKTELMRPSCFVNDRVTGAVLIISLKMFPCNNQLFYNYLILYSRNYPFNFLHLRFHVFIVTSVFSGWCIVNMVHGSFKSCFPVPAALPQFAASAIEER